MKKHISLLLALLLALTVVSASADTATHYDYTATYVNRSATAIDDVYNWFCEPFNVDIEPIGLAWGSIPETNSVMITGGTMYDIMMIPNNYGVVLSYAEQGLLKPLPDGWREKYPNIARAFEVGGVGNFFELNGKTYAIPNINCMNFATEDYCLDVTGTYYRDDWAKELGFTFGNSVTITEFNKYLKACVEKDMAGNGQTIGLSTPYVYQYVQAYKNVEQTGSRFVRVGDEYLWAPQVEGTVDGIKAAKRYYQEGLIDPDFFTLDVFAGQNKLCAGLCAATYCTVTVANYNLILSNATAAGMENAKDKIKPIVVTDDNGVLHVNEAANWNWVKVFSPDMSDDKFERLLSMYDFWFTKEAELVWNMGIEGVDWSVSEDGVYTSYLPAEYETIRAKYPSIWFWFNVTSFSSDFDLINPAYDHEIQKTMVDSLNTRFALTKEKGFTRLDNNVQFLDTEAYRNYSVDIDSEMYRIICDATISEDEVEAEWNAFIDANAGIWQPVVDDLNAIIQ